MSTDSLEKRLMSEYVAFHYLYKNGKPWNLKL